MKTELATVKAVPLPAPLSMAPVDVLSAWLGGRNPRTLAAYSRDVDDFAAFLESPSGTAAVELLLSMSHGDANALALAYRAHLINRGLKSATIARRLAALRSVVKLARTLGRIAWALDVESPKVEPYRDTAGPGENGWRSMLSAAKLAAESCRAKAVRDLALVRLLHDLALRRSEVVALDVASIDLEAGTVDVIGKGKTQALRMTLPDPTRDALAAWLDIRGADPGPLFVRLDRARDTGELERLTDTAVYQIVRALGTTAGLSRPTRPHALRHQAITRALDATGGDVRTVQRFSRHADTRTLLLYDDRRNDLAGEVAKMVAAD